jgi:hypothetical protein
MGRCTIFYRTVFFELAVMTRSYSLNRHDLMFHVEHFSGFAGIRESLLREAAGAGVKKGRYFPAPAFRLLRVGVSM